MMEVNESIEENWRLPHQSTLLMQLEAVLEEISIKEKHKIKLNKWLKEFISCCKNLEKSQQFQLDNLRWIKDHNISVPIPNFSSLPKLKGSFTFVPIQDACFVGSFATEAATTHSRVIDVALILPKEFMHCNDLTNGRWLIRRALYLSWLGNKLRECSNLVESMSWTYHCGSLLRPTLQITPSGKLGSRWKINLFPVPPEGYFKHSQISPAKGLVFGTWFSGREKSDEGAAPPTPYYNWACGVDVMMLEHCKFISENMKCPNWIEGVKLCKIWLSQRYLNKGEGSMSSHIIPLLVIYLSQTRKIASQMSSYQVFRTVILTLMNNDFAESGLSLATKKQPANRSELLLLIEDFKEFYPLVFIDPSGYLNVAAPVTSQTYLEVRHECEKTIQILELSISNSVEVIFIKKREFHLAFDQTLTIECDHEMLSKIIREKVMDTEAVVLDHLGDIRPTCFKTIISTLSKGFGDRVELIGVMRDVENDWAFGSEPPAPTLHLKLGLVLHPKSSTGLLTMGPAADAPEQKKFCEFWGDICTLRRFQDSTFHEAIQWAEADDPIGERRLIMGKIANYILMRQYGIPENRITYLAGQFEDTIRMPNYQFNFKYGTGEEANAKAILAYDSLSRKLRSLNLPLNISAVHSSSEILRHSCVFPPLSRSVPLLLEKMDVDEKLGDYVKVPSNTTGCSYYRFAIDVLLFLEISGKWPDDLLAIKAIKVEFMYKITTLLRENDGLTVIVFPTHLQLIWEGFIFNIKICYRKEIYLRRLVDVNGTWKEEETQASIDLETQIEILPRLSLFLNSLQSDFQSYSGSVRLIQRWVSSQMLLPHIPHIVVELLTAHLFLSPHPYKPPNTPHVALLRFLHLMAHTDWMSTPILVNLGNQITATDENEIIKRFTLDRSSYPPLFLCSPSELRPLSDQSEESPETLNKRFRLISCWTKSSPSLPILARIKIISTAALQFYNENVTSRIVDFKTMFRHSLGDYDVLIYLWQKELARRLESLNATKCVTIKPYQHIKGEKMPPVMFDLVQYYLRELRESYGAHALFFHDEHGGDVIGVVWKPHVLEPQNANMNTMDGHRLVGVKNVQQVVNVEAIIEDFTLLGEGLVKKIKIK